MEHIGNARAVLNDSRISLKGSQIDVFSGLKGGTKRQEEEYEEYGGPQKYKVEITELLHQAFCLNNPESFYNLFRRVRSLKDDKVAYMVTCYDLKDRRFDEIDWMSIAESSLIQTKKRKLELFLIN